LTQERAGRGEEEFAWDGRVKDSRYLPEKQGVRVFWSYELKRRSRLTKEHAGSGN